MQCLPSLCTHGHAPLLANDFLIPEQYHFCETRCKEQRRTILSHMRYNSPVDRKAEQGDSDGRETAREAGLGKAEIPAQRFHTAKRPKVINKNVVMKCSGILSTD